ncbi:hypothetical protein AK830_g12082 [Neonectria ditissima]|uniref:Uncharacterized protein n=1 Tax=Neonectria ditissima TaxID=78410 RepID=A0A0P7AZV6_9HYPO|nr:hypothetical protein AK830_g12082 [Neonectria ditissima]
MSVNPDSVTSATGEFSSKVAPSEPLTTKGHAPGVQVGPPEFHLETHKPGTAPADRSFESQYEPEAKNSKDASETLGGATSADVNKGHGRPAEGTTSQESHGKGKKDSSGLEGVGANASDPIHEQGHDKDHETGEKNAPIDVESWTTAEERTPVGAEEISKEFPG